MKPARILLLASLAVLFFAAAPRDAQAQDCIKLSYDSLRVVFTGRPILRVQGPWGLAQITEPRVEGALLHYARVLPDTLHPAQPEPPNPIALADLRRADVLTSNTTTGALLGGLACVAVLALASSSLAPGGSGGATSSFMNYLPGAASVMAVAGGVSLGAVLGSRWHSWKPLYTQP